MNKEVRETLGALIGIALGMIGGLWLVSWLFHLGPDMRTENGPWWGFAYYFTSIAGSCVVWWLSGTAIYAIVQRFPVSAGAPTDG